MARRGIAFAALALLLLGRMPPALAQTWTPTFDLIVTGTVIHVTHDQTFDYGFHPPEASIAAQLHNGPNPECLFSAKRSDTGATQYQNIGGSNGYDTSGQYRDPPRVVLSLPIPITWTLTLACGQAGTIKAIVATEAPPPPPPPPPPPGPSPTAVQTPPAHPPAPPAPTKSASPPKPAPSPLVQGLGKRRVGQGPAALPATVPVATPIVVEDTPTPPPPAAAPSPSASPSPSPSPKPSPSPTQLGAPRSEQGHGPNLLLFFLSALGAVGVLVALLYAFGPLRSGRR